MIQKDLAATLREIGAKGSAAFYQGPIAEKFAAYMKAEGGLIDQKDLAGIKANEDTPVRINYKGIDVFECPPNSQGFVMLQALNILEGMNVRYMRHNSAPYLHAVTESLKLAFADRNKYVADPKFTPNIPMREMLSKEYAAIRRALIDPDKAIAGEAPFGNPTPRRRIDRRSAAGRVSRAPQPSPDLHAGDHRRRKRPHHLSRRRRQGSQHGVGHLVAAQPVRQRPRRRRAPASCSTTAWPTTASTKTTSTCLKPGKRVRQTINPALALKDGKPYMVFGTPGADTQPQAQLQFFLNVAEFGMNVQQALEQDYVVSTSFKSSYYPHDAEGKLQVPATLPKHVLDELAAMGHKLDIRNVRGVGSVKAIIVIHPRTGVLMGGVSPTRDSYVMAYYAKRI